MVVFLMRAGRLMQSQIVVYDLKRQYVEIVEFLCKYKSWVGNNQSDVMLVLTTN